MKSKNNIMSQPRVGARLAFSGWVFLLLLPLLLLNTAFDQYVSFTCQRNMVAGRDLLNNEISQFIEDLSPQKWLQSKIDEFNQKFGFREFSQEEFSAKGAKGPAESAKKIKNELEKFLGVQVAVLFSYGADSENPEIEVAEKEDFEFKKPPLVFLKRILTTLNRQVESISMKDLNSVGKFFQSEPKILEKQEMANNSLIRTIFGNITELSFKPGKVAINISSRLGNTGPVFFIFSPATVTKGSNSANVGGYLAIVRLQDISPEMIFSAAVKSSFLPEITRKIYKSKNRLEFPQKPGTQGLCGYIEDDSGLHLQAILPEKSLVHLLQRGTIVPMGLKAFSQHVPMIEVSIPAEILVGELGKYRKSVKSILLLTFLLGTAIFFRISLFGLNFKLPISGKILLSLALISLFPLLILGIAYGSFVEFEDSNRKELLRKIMLQKISNVQKQLNSEISEVEQENIRFAIGLDKEKSKASEYYKTRFQNFVNNGFAEIAMVEELESDREFFQRESASKEERLSKFEIKAFSYFSQNIAEHILSSIYYCGEGPAISRIIQSDFSNSESVMKILRTSGKLMAIPRITKRFWFSSMLLSGNDEKRMDQPQIHMLACFDISRLLEKFFKKITQPMKVSEDTGEYKIDVTFALRNGEQIRILPDVSSRRLKDEDTYKKLRLTNFLGRPLSWEFDKERTSIIDMTSYDEGMPFICLVRGEMNSDQTGFLYSQEFSQAIFYLALLAILILLISRQFFVQPLLMIVSGLKEIAAGNLKYKFKISSGDEFEGLANSLNKMVRGLIEKEIIAEYVSDDAKQDVSATISGEFKPGGELIEASVLFCDPTEFEDYIETSDPEQVIGYLDNYIDSVSKICSENGGEIDKIIENTLMLVFRTANNKEDHSLRAAKAALAIASLFGSRYAAFPFSCKIGVSTGKVISGKIGSKVGKLDFTVIGDTVNMAARLKAGASIAEKTGILVSSSVFEKLANEAVMQEKQQVAIKGKKGLHKVYELVALRK